MDAVLVFGLLAQLVEQLTLNQRVAGSSPSQPIGCQTLGADKRWCESISKTFMLFFFVSIRRIAGLWRFFGYLKVLLF